MSDSIVAESTLKTIKAINERLAAYERQGLTDSYYYQQIVERIELEGLPTTKSKTGTIRLSRAKADIANTDLSALARVSKMPSLKEERARVKAKGYKTKSEQNQRIKDYGYVSQWIDENLNDLYDDKLSGMEEAETFVNALQNGIRNDDYTYIKDLIRRYEEAKAKRDKILEESVFAVTDEDISGGDMSYWMEEF